MAPLLEDFRRNQRFELSNHRSGRIVQQRAENLLQKNVPMQATAWTMRRAPQAVKPFGNIISPR